MDEDPSNIVWPHETGQDRIRTLPVTEAPPPLRHGVRRPAQAHVRAHRRDGASGSPPCPELTLMRTTLASLGYV